MAQSSLKFRLVLVTIVTLASIRLQGTTVHGPKTDVEPDSVSWSALVQVYSPLFGEDYRAGGKSPGGFDCSGLLQFTFGQLNIKLPASSRDYAHQGQAILRDSLVVGDFLLFSGRSAQEIGHVGLCVGLKDGQIIMLHSATHGGVLIENWVGQSYYERRFLGGRRIFTYVP